MAIIFFRSVILALAGSTLSGLVLVGLSSPFVLADGKIVRPKDYNGSLEEKAQEAIIVFHESKNGNSAHEDLILKITVQGEAEKFAWVVPFPSEPKISKEDPKLFKELFDYVEAKKRERSMKRKDRKSLQSPSGLSAMGSVDVMSRQVVGEFEIAIVKETETGGLNPWLVEEGFQKLENAADVLEYYRKLGYCFVCIKVSSEALKEQKEIVSHPLRFSFLTGGRDGIYFPMKMTSLQEKPFDVNLYVFYRSWLNDKLSSFGFRHRGFSLNYRDWDSPKCIPNTGKSWSLPQEDPFLAPVATKIPTVVRFFQKLYPGQKYYLTNLQVSGVLPQDIRQWKSYLWLFPHYTDKRMVPYDARERGPAAGSYLNAAEHAVPPTHDMYAEISNRSDVSSSDAAVWKSSSEPSRHSSGETYYVFIYQLAFILAAVGVLVFFVTNGLPRLRRSSISPVQRTDEAQNFNNRM